MKRLAVLGPESTGKSTLCKDLSQFYEIDFVPEFSREFLNNLSRPYLKADLNVIAQGQLQSINKSLQSEKNLVISDTELLTIKVWSIIKYGHCDDKIENLLMQQELDFYILCDTDIPWQSDPLREVPSLKIRREIFKLFKSEMDSMNWNYKVVSGDRISRLNRSKEIIESF